MGEKVIGGVEPLAASGLDSMAEMQGVPVDDDGGEQVEAGDPVMLTFGGTIADFALASDAQDVLERVMRLALVEADLRAALHADIEDPVDDEQSPLDPADLAQRGGQIVLAWTGGELAQDAAWRDLPGAHCGDAAEQIGPVGDDQRVAQLAAHQWPQLAGRGMALGTAPNRS